MKKVGVDMSVTNDNANLTGVGAPFRTPHSALRTSNHDALVKQTEKWVATSFYGTLLKQARQSPFKDDRFSGGRGGEMFGSLQDQQFADRMSRGTGKKLVMAIVRKIEATQAYQTQENISRAKAAVAKMGLNAPRTVESIPSANGGANVATVR
jgi:Rod binding domain-containing protein